MSTCHGKLKGVSDKPVVVIDYNQCMQYVNSSDQLVNVLRRRVNDIFARSFIL